MCVCVCARACGGGGDKFYGMVRNDPDKIRIRVNFLHFCQISVLHLLD